MTTSSTDAVVSIGWLVDRLDEVQKDDPSIRLLEVDIDPSNYEHEHIPGASKVDWRTDLQDPTTFDVPSEAAFEEFLGGFGIRPDSTVVIYGDMMNWFAAHAYWLFTYYGHADVRLLDGGRDFWGERDAPLTTKVPEFTSQSYVVDENQLDIRADRPDVMDAIERETALVDVRTPEEYRGEILAPPGWNEGVQRGGHIPGARNIPWNQVVESTGCFKPEDELRSMYEEHGIDADADVITYCRIGERSALTWFVLHEVLGYEDVRNYYGSWVEWGNTVGAPIEKGQRAAIKRE
ncbi:sulfurtransferase [Halovenus rubra]|uniref:Sulfurtransferase n=2 Tax=Halovenus rubra TaxID=869890 RepID=A0ABD5X9N2_9EURY|nr:sulfurtransferase [Halovenus rubra]